jgi:nucleotide-binding universal stress UspA family protein
MGGVETILVGYDGTRPSERALERAAELAQAFGARVVVTWVAPPPIDPGYPPDAAAFGLSPVTSLPDPDLLDAEDAVWRQHREHVVAVFERRGIRYDLERSLGRPDDELVALADELHADLIVLGTREPGFFERLLGGSVSQSVARHAHCDVLIVHGH